MTLVLTRTQRVALIERAGRATERATALRSSSRSLVAASTEVSRRRALHRYVRRVSDPHGVAGEIGAFELHGFIDGDPMTAVWLEGVGRRALQTDDEVRKRMTIIVALGETFPLPADETVVIKASMIAAVPAMLTAIRAMDRVVSVDVTRLKATIGPLDP